MTKDPHSEKKLLVALEVSNSKWVLAFTNGEKIRRKTIEESYGGLWGSDHRELLIPIDLRQNMGVYDLLETVKRP